MSDYGFEVIVPHVKDYTWGQHTNKEWTVRLPHSCDEWVIAWSEDKSEAIADLESFIAQAQAALERLRTLTAGTVPDA